MKAIPIAATSPRSTNAGPTPTCGFARRGRNIGSLLSPENESSHRFAVLCERHGAWIFPAWFPSFELVVVKSDTRP